MTEAFRQSLDALAAADPDALDEVIGDAEDAAFSRDWSELGDNDPFVGTAPPVEILRGQLKSASDLASALEQVQPRWQLDVILAVSDYLNQD